MCRMNEDKEVYNDLPQLPTTIPKYLHPQLSSSNRDFFTIEFACLQNEETTCE